MSAKSNVSQGVPQGVGVSQPPMGGTQVMPASTGPQSWDTATSYGPEANVMPGYGGGFNPAMGVTPIGSIGGGNSGYQPSTGWSNGQPAQFDAQGQQMNAAPNQPPQPRDSGLMNTYSSMPSQRVGLTQGRPGQQAGACPTCGR